MWPLWHLRRYLIAVATPAACTNYWLYPDGEDHEGWIEHGKCKMAGIGNVNSDAGAEVASMVIMPAYT